MQGPVPYTEALRGALGSEFFRKMLQESKQYFLPKEI